MPSRPGLPTPPWPRWCRSARRIQAPATTNYNRLQSQRRVLRYLSWTRPEPRKTEPVQEKRSRSKHRARPTSGPADDRAPGHGGCRWTPPSSDLQGGGLPGPHQVSRLHSAPPVPRKAWGLPHPDMAWFLYDERGRRNIVMPWSWRLALLPDEVDVLHPKPGNKQTSMEPNGREIHMASLDPSQVPS